MYRLGSHNYLLVFILGISLLLRFLFLDQKPAHFDEGINGWFVAGIWDKGFYSYDPSNFHGPLYFYLLQFTEVLFESSPSSYRFVNGWVSIFSSIVLLWICYLNRIAGLFSFIAISTSCAYVFYSRYAIHETFFVFFQILFFCGYVTWKFQKSRWALYAMIFGFFGTLVNKETFFIFFGTLLIAEGVLSIFSRIKPDAPTPELRIRWSHDVDKREIYLGWTIGLAMTLWIFSGFGMDMGGVLRFFEAFAFWSKTGMEEGHSKPFYYWLELILLYEPLFLMSLLLIWLPIFLGHRVWRLSALLGFGLFLAYSIIPYKTPWLFISIAWPLAIHLGFSLSWFIERFSHYRKIIYGLAGICLVWQLALTVRLSFFNYENPKEKYVYVQTRKLIQEIISYLEKLAVTRTSIYNSKVSLLLKDTWPLPWLFQKFTRIGYGLPSEGQNLHDDIIVIDHIELESIRPILKGSYYIWTGPLRDSMGDISILLKDHLIVSSLLPPGFKQQNFFGEGE